MHRRYYRLVGHVPDFNRFRFSKIGLTDPNIAAIHIFKDEDGKFVELALVEDTESSWESLESKVKAMVTLEPVTQPRMISFLHELRELCQNKARPGLKRIDYYIKS